MESITWPYSYGYFSESDFLPIICYTYIKLWQQQSYLYVNGTNQISQCIWYDDPEWRCRWAKLHRFSELGLSEYVMETIYTMTAFLFALNYSNVSHCSDSSYIPASQLSGCTPVKYFYDTLSKTCLNTYLSFSHAIRRVAASFHYLKTIY